MQLLNRILITSFVFAVTAGTCGAAEQSSETAITAAGRAWVDAFNRRDADAMAALTTEDVVLLPPNAEPVRGREGVRAVWSRAVADAKATVTVDAHETVTAGDIAYRTGEYAYTLPAGQVVDRGKFLEIWKRVDGKWRIHRDMYSSNLPVRVPVPSPPPSQPRLDRSEAAR